MKGLILAVVLLFSSGLAWGSVGANPNEYTTRIMHDRFEGMKKDLYDASRIAGVSMDDIVAIGSLESDLRAKVKNPCKGCSASGVLQYTASSWNVDRKKYHKELGLPANVSVTNQRANLLIGAKSLSETRQNLADRTHLTIDTVRPGDLYMSHFLGETGAVRVINSNSNTPMNRLVSISKANRPLFVKPNGQVRTAREFRQHLDRIVAIEKSFYKDKVQEHKLAMKQREIMNMFPTEMDKRLVIAVNNTRAYVGYNVNS